MGFHIAGCWKLVAWRRIEADGSVSFPLGADATGTLIYTPDFKMAVQLVAANRPNLDTTNALGGSVEERAAAYSTCLAYFGRYSVDDNAVTHYLDGCLFPNWSGTVQHRPFTFEDGELVLRTPPTTTAEGSVVNEIVWVRDTQDTAC